MVLAAFFCVFSYGRNIPLAEDWLLVAPLTGNEADMHGWLWAQNNEHRIPLPKLLMLGLLKVTGANFKAGMYANVFLLSSLALMVILFLRSMRGGRTKYVDAFVPVLFLHIGNWENMVWSWQLSFVLPSVFTLVIFMILIKEPLVTRLRDAALIILLILMLPLCGGNGLLYVPFLTLWLLYCAFFHWSKGEDRTVKKNMVGLLLAGSILSILLFGLYFVGYQQPTWNPDNPGLVESLKTAGKFVVLSVGPAVKFSWKIAALAVVITSSVIAWSTYLVVRSSLYSKGRIQKHRAWSILLYLGILFVFTVAIGWGRAALVPQFGMPDRYVLFASPILFVSFFAGEFFDRSGYLQALLFVMMLVLLPSNTRAGFIWKNWYQTGIVAVENDLAGGLSSADLAKRNKSFLIHWWDDEKLKAHIEMLQKMDNSPFSIHNTTSE
jgi:hypothetical protein